MADDVFEHTPDDEWVDADDVWHLGEWAKSPSGDLNLSGTQLGVKGADGQGAGGQTPTGTASRHISVNRTTTADF